MKKILADGGYEGADFQARVKATFGVDLAISLRSRETKGFVVVPIRWVVARTFGWFVRFRRLSKDYERWPETAKASSIWRPFNASCDILFRLPNSQMRASGSSFLNDSIGN